MKIEYQRVNYSELLVDDYLSDVDFKKFDKSDRVRI